MENSPNSRAPGQSSRRMEEKRVGVYFGESSKLLYERSKEHVNDAESFKECQSRQVAEAIKIHYTKDEILNSKNESNSNHLSRVAVEEDAYGRKRKARQEEKLKAEHRRKPKRKSEEDDNIPTGWKRQPNKLRRMESCEEVYDMQE